MKSSKKQQDHSEFLRKAVKEREKALDELDRETARLEQALHRIEMDLERIDDERAQVSAELRAFKVSLANFLQNVDLREYEPSTKASPRGRGLSSHWKAVIKEMVRVGPEPSGYDLIERVLEREGKPAKRSNLRRHLMLYVDKGLLKRSGQGMFVPTEQGRKAAGVVVLPKSIRQNRSGSKDETPDATASSVSDNGNEDDAPLLSESPWVE